MTTRTRLRRRVPDVLSSSEQARLCRQPNRRSPTGLRNLCMLRVMLDAGLRAAELLALGVQDIDWRTGKLLVRQGKGQKDRVLWVNTETLELLRQWRECHPLAHPTLLFTTLTGRALRTNYLRAMVKRYGRKAGLTKDVHPHLLRHTFATDLYRETKNIRLVQKALGHANLATTMIYTHIVDDELEEALKQLRSR